MQPPEPDAVFKALADPTRRLVLDRLRQQNGQTLGLLCDRLGMARQSATQHIDVLIRAGLVTVVRRGRERLHYLDPSPIHELQQRWISAFDQPRLAVIDTVRSAAERLAMSENADTAVEYVYVTYIRATAEQVWQALTDADLSGRFWGHRNVSDWQPGSVWEHQRTSDGVAEAGGVVLVTEPPHRLVMTFGDPGTSAEARSRVTFLIEPGDGIVRLTVTHEGVETAEDRAAISLGWPAVLANLKSLLETGEALPTDPWTMPAR